LSTVEQHIVAIKREMGVSRLTVVADPVAVVAQTRADEVISFLDALRLALQSFLEDGRDVESPVGMITADPTSVGLPVEVDASAVRERLRDLLNDESASLQLLTPTEPYPPERGESIEANWLFRLRVPQTFSSLLWAVVDRSGVRPAYNYGFE
jgi:hypothetical protein